MKQSELIADLISRTNEIIDKANGYKALAPTLLNSRPAAESWSVLECLAHLNLYGNFYLKEIEQRIISSPQIKSDPEFSSGWFGERTVVSMLPKNGKVNKMKTFKDKIPDPSNIGLQILDQFIKQQQQLINLLELSKTVHLNKVTTRITLPLLRFYLGTTLRFVVYHNQRHIWQAENALKEVIK